MVQKFRSLIFTLLLLLPFILYGEGSKQLTPNRSTAALTSTLNDKAGYLAHDANLPSATGVAITSLSFLKPAGFSRNGATYSKDHRLYIRVKAGERLFYGVHRAIHDQTNANQANLIITLRRTNSVTGIDDAAFSQANTLTANTSSTRDMLLVANQNGVIDNATEAENGPNRSINGKTVTNGYTPLSIYNNTAVDYDYYVEFTQVGESSWTDDGRRFSVYDLWDFTVIDATGNEKPGRMRSKLWSFSAGGTNNVFSKDFNMYPLIPSEDQPDRYFVKKVELAGLSPQNFFRFVTNQYGSITVAGTSITERRKSQTSQTDYPELFNFVNNPDPTIWPSATAPTFSVNLSFGCNTTTNGGKAIFTLNTSESSTFLVLINLNGVEGYQPGTADVLVESTGPKGMRTIEWNGLNGLGQVVAKNTSLNFFFRNNSASLHFPVWDAEANADGFRAQDIRPLVGSNYNSLLFWDDSNLPTTAFPAPQTELYGIVSTAGVHRWGSATSTAGDLKTVNTWTYGYTESSTRTAVFTYDCSADIAVTNTVEPAPYIIGKPVTYTLTVTNNGPVAASNVQVTDKLDLSKLEFVSASDAANYTANTGVWNIGSLAIGASRTLTITAKPLVLGTISTTATQTHTEPDNVTANDKAVASITVQSAADIEVKNTSDKTNYSNGDLVTYTITAKNLGPNTATGVIVTDKLPTGLTLEGTAPAGYNATTGAWAVGSLALNETKTLTLKAKVSSLGSITTTADLGSRTGYELDDNSNNNTSATTITIAPASDVAVTNMVSNATPNQNGSITYTIQAINNGPNDATNVIVSGALPTGLSFTGYTASVGTVGLGSGTGTWNIGTIPAGNTQTLTLTAKTTITGTINLTLSQSHSEYDSNGLNNAATSIITVKPTAEVAVTNVVTSPIKTTYANGDQITYTVTVKNNGPSPATNLVVTDKLPTSLIFTNAVPTTGTYTSGTGAWNIGTLASGTSTTLTLTATVNQSAVITTTATQTHTEFDDVTGNNSASNTITSGNGVVTADIQVSVLKSAGPYYTGQDITLTARVKNAGQDAATDLKVSVPIPAGFTLKQADPQIGSYDGSTWTVGNLSASGVAELSLIVTPNVDNTTIGNKDYTFAAAKVSANESDTNPNNNSASTSLTVQKLADVAVTVDVTGDVNGIFYKGLTEATFTMRLTNKGPDKATNLVGRDTRTGTIDFTYVEPGKGYNSQTGEWLVSELAAGETISLVVKGKPNTTGRLNLGGTKLSQDQTDLVPENDRAVALVNVVPVAELQVTNTAARTTLPNGEITTLIVSVKNNGTDAATGVQILGKLPTGLSLVGSDPSVGTYDEGSGIWTLGTDLLPNTTQTLVLTVKPTSPASYTTTASIALVGQYDSNPNNNSQAATIQSVATADIAVSSSIVDGPYAVGGQYLVTITAKNLGPNVATGVVIAAGVAPGLKLVPGSGTPDPGTTIDPAAGLWTIGNLGVNESRNLTLLAQPAAIGILNSLGYKYAANEFDPNGGNTKDGNNSTVIHITVPDQEATYQVLAVSKHLFAYQTGEHLAEVTDPDGPIENARIINGSLPAGVRLDSDGELEIDNRFLLIPGTYNLTIETTDALGGISENTITYTILGDWDQDGIPDAVDVDDNNDGIPDLGSFGVDPRGDDDGDGIPNYIDVDFVHPFYGGFRDRNYDGINDAFDMDEDGLIAGYDLDEDGDGIPNAIEANEGIVPPANIYDAAKATFIGSVGVNGLPDAVEDSPDSGVSTLVNPDTDNDGVSDYIDIDADNDGILDNFESQATNAYVNGLGTDGDFDGLSDGYDGTTGGEIIIPIDIDGDGFPDYRDTDSDDDFSGDYVEAFDDDAEGESFDDLFERARVFEEEYNKGWYVNSDVDESGFPNWLAWAPDYPAFLTPGSSYYHDTDRDGLVDLFDIDNGGHSVSLQTASNGEYAFRQDGLIILLPVALTRFEGKMQTEGVLLTWSTASEKNNAHFLVERSTDGINFTAISQVAGAGTTNLQSDYSLLDAKVSLATTYYYRLKQVDFNGKYEYSEIIAVQSKTVRIPVEVNIYPNPTSDVVKLDFSRIDNGKKIVEVFTIEGKLVAVHQNETDSTISIDLAKLPTGTYLLKISSPQFETVKRVVKQ
ncbi:T9SS type A sorting domain-containing protein [Adhaeribacter radiodurans]|uniref:DUF11 domain-containing protein n=1 Tax=Adhaeribacter radiodurans TaxID=2745197 RepID=A0A7L7L4W2_9BACT|nr:T9SS type A sorting domain-containing protein [Adhaeribacter radiodurans]QMU27842.1 DUF11 domain-containing protein [Adhaeribacter radiodurans]